MAGNLPSTEAYVWSAMSLITLLSGLGLILLVVGKFNYLGWKSEGAGPHFLHSAPAAFKLAPSQWTTGWFFAIVALLFLAQSALGGLLAHYRVETGAFSDSTSPAGYPSRGEWQERTEWHNLVGFQRIGEILRDYVRKGPRIFVEGELRTRSWEDRESGQRKFRTEIVVHEVSLLSHASATNGSNGVEHYVSGDDFVPQEFSAEHEIEASEVPY